MSLLLSPSPLLSHSLWKLSNTSCEAEQCITAKLPPFALSVLLKHRAAPGVIGDNVEGICFFPWQWLSCRIPASCGKAAGDAAGSCADGSCAVVTHDCCLFVSHPAVFSQGWTWLMENSAAAGFVIAWIENLNFPISCYQLILFGFIFNRALLCLLKRLGPFLLSLQYTIGTISMFLFKVVFSPKSGQKADAVQLSQIMSLLLAKCVTHKSVLYLSLHLWCCQWWKETFLTRGTLVAVNLAMLCNAPRVPLAFLARGHTALLTHGLSLDTSLALLNPIHFLGLPLCLPIAVVCSSLLPT